ncbi:MAG: Gfo/Idh/MocA family oxidoreductase [Fuerstiella sp.]|nr:Gfo/Idh/MocA family oxidoreductase [Fuerstiella sp.]
MTSPAEIRRTANTRRNFLKAAALSAPLVPYLFSSRQVTAAAKNDRLQFAAIGVGGRGSELADQTKAFGDLVAVCDVDRNHAARARERSGGKADIFGDYRKLLERKDIDAVTIGTPDHWHVPIAIAACRSGKDVYCEKPLTLTVQEGQELVRVVKETGRVLQVGSQQRSEFGGLFLKAVAIVHAGRLGKLKNVLVSQPAAPVGGPFATQPVPEHLDWDMWLGQTPKVDYIPQRCHGTFRYWFEYSGGMMTDWGAHHVDIAHWGMGMQNTGPEKIDGRADLPTIKNGYNTPSEFEVDMVYPGGLPVKLLVKKGARSGVLFEGEKGRIFVNRGTLSGKPVDQLADDPLPEEAISKLYRGKQPGSHMRNFVDCVRSRELPISDVESQHRTTTALHLANISIRLGRPIKWNPKTETITDDEEATAMLSRKPREGYEWL